MSKRMTINLLTAFSWRRLQIFISEDICAKAGTENAPGGQRRGVLQYSYGKRGLEKWQDWGLIEEDIVLPEKDGFILCDENGVGRVTLLSVIGKGGTAIAYKAIRRRNGSTVTCIVKEYFRNRRKKAGDINGKKQGTGLQ